MCVLSRNLINLLHLEAARKFVSELFPKDAFLLHPCISFFLDLQQQRSSKRRHSDPTVKYPPISALLGETYNTYQLICFLQCLRQLLELVTLHRCLG